MPPSYWKLVSKRSPRSSRKPILRPLREEGHLAEALLEHRPVVVDRLEDLHVRQPADAGAATVRLGAALELAHRLAALVGLGVLVAVAPDREVEPLGQRVDDRDADAVQAAGDLVAAAVAELAAGVQHGQDDLGRRALLLLHHVHRDAAAVVGHGDAVVRVDDDLDLVGLAGERLVDRVVHHLVDQVMEASHAGRADVHAGPLANGLEALEDGDVLSPVGAVSALAGGAVILRGCAFVRLGDRAVSLILLLAVLGPFRQVVPFIARPSTDR